MKSRHSAGSFFLKVRKNTSSLTVICHFKACPEAQRGGLAFILSFRGSNATEKSFAAM
jgi:hypothetical protein